MKAKRKIKPRIAGSEKLVGRSLRLPADLDAKITALAAAEDRTWSKMVVKAVREMIDRASATEKD